MVRVIKEDGEQAGIMATEQALTMAVQSGLDLVEVAPDAKPPVCRMLDYGKFKYKQKKRTQQSHGKQHVAHVKEVRFRPKIDEHDVQVKVKRARGFLEKKDRVLITMQFRGREMAHIDVGREVLEHVIEELSDLARVERNPRMDGRRMSVTMIPK